MKDQDKDDAVRSSRRMFLKTATGATVVGSLAGKFAKAAAASFPMRTLGHTGEKVSIVGIGGYHLGVPPEEEAIRIVRTAIDHGVNFMDNCWDYNDGESEVRMGKALRDGYRQKVFLMTKIDGRTKEAAAAADRRVAEAPADRPHRPDAVSRGHPRGAIPTASSREGGAWKLRSKRKRPGKIRYIGFTGHKSPDIHLKMLETASTHDFTFDTVQMPLNVMDAHFHSFEQQVLPVLVKHDIGVLGMKPLGERADPEQQDRVASRVPALRHEPADLRGDHRLRLHGDPGAGAGRRSQLQADGETGSSGASREDGSRGRGRRVRGLQDDQHVRRHHPQPAVARVAQKIKASRMSDIKTCHGLREFSRIRQTNQKQVDNDPHLGGTLCRRSRGFSRISSFLAVHFLWLDPRKSV